MLSFLRTSLLVALCLLHLREETLVVADCVADIPTDNTNAVQISFYRNEGGEGKLGDDCPVSCDGEPLMEQYYAIADNEDKCFQWPGGSGENAMKSGMCHATERMFSYDQWTNCDCEGDVGNAKEVFLDKCVVDVPTTLCVKLIDFSACEGADEDEGTNSTDGNEGTNSTDGNEASRGMKIMTKGFFWSFALSMVLYGGFLII